MVHMLSFALHLACTHTRGLVLLIHISGGPSSRARASKKPRSDPVRDPEPREPRAPRKKMSVSKKRKETRTNYAELSAVDYATLRQKDWYTTVPRDTEIEDTDYWCEEQMHIFQDIYSTYKFPTRPMRPIELSFLKGKNTFKTAARVIEAFGMVHLMELRCPYNAPLIVQFFSTLVIKNDAAHTMKWMSGSTPC